MKPRLVFIMLRKKLNLLSMIFIILSFLSIGLISAYLLNLKESFYDVLLNYDRSLILNFYEIYNLLLLFSLVFSMLLTFLETCDNVFNFDSYFISLYKHHRVFSAKILSTILIILFETFSLYLILSFLFVLKYRDLNLFLTLIKPFLVLSLYTFLLYLFGYLLMLLFKSYFSILSLFFIYWLNRLTCDLKIDKVLKYLFLRVKVFSDSLKVSFEVEELYLGFYFLSFLILLAWLYRKQDN